MERGIEEAALSTVGWFEFAAGTVGLAAGQTLRLSVVNLGPRDAIVLCGLWSNPHPLSMARDSYTIGPGDAWNCDLEASDLAREIIDKVGRAQIRGLVRSSSREICVNVEVFDSKTGRTSIILPLQEVAHRK